MDNWRVPPYAYLPSVEGAATLGGLSSRLWETALRTRFSPLILTGGEEDPVSPASARGDSGPQWLKQWNMGVGAPPVPQKTCQPDIGN
jgi:hypothetical protein